MLLSYTEGSGQRLGHLLFYLLSVLSVDLCHIIAFTVESIKGKKLESGSYAGNFKMVSVFTLLHYKNRKLFRIHMDITYSSLSHIGGFKTPPDRPVSESTIRRCGRGSIGEIKSIMVGKN